MRMKLFLPLCREDVPAANLFSPVSGGFFGANWGLRLGALGRDCVVCDHEMWFSFPSKWTAFSRSCSGSFVSSTSSTRSCEGLVYLRARPEVFSCFALPSLLWPHPLPWLQMHPCANDTHSHNSALTSFPNSFCKCIQGFSFPRLFCRHLKCTMSQTESLVSSCPQSTPPPFYHHLN